MDFHLTAKKHFISTLFLFIGLNAFAQKVTYNHLVDASHGPTQQIMALFENYIGSNPQLKAENPYWNSEEQAKYKNFDFLEEEFEPSLYMGLPAHVLSISFKEDVAFIKVQFSYCKADGTPYVLAIVNYLAKKVKGKYRLFNRLPLNRQSWNCTTVGRVDFYYPDYHEFNYEKAGELNVFINNLCENFGVKPKPFDYYMAANYDEIQVLKGIDYYLGMGGVDRPSGKAAENKVYCGGLGEFYAHEVFHVQLQEHFPEMHFWVSEGIATFLGGSRGQSLDWHLKKTNDFLAKNPKIDLSELLTLKNLDSETAYHYSLGGLIARKFWETGKYPLLKKMMATVKTDADYYKAIETYLGIPKDKLNHYLRDQLAHF
ncbi:hypothetical protein [Croceivirga radicis]|uniref:hypothetical protein n=1 Tax=Croceivirga radicis TaxID=1929488 RepID=UPI000255B292|nr:hypothetical protein [Croceivirga radicis]